jgi:hypothetical protein
MQYLGIDWGTRRAAWCALSDGGQIVEGMMPAEEEGLARLVLELGPDVRGCIEMMSGAVWVRDRLSAAGWEIQIADARKVKAIAPLACKTDRVDARVLAELVKRDLVTEVWVPSLTERELRERLRRRAHLLRLKTSATNRTLGCDAVGPAREPDRATQARDARAARRARDAAGVAYVDHDAARGDRRPRPADHSDRARIATDRAQQRAGPIADEHPGDR